MSHTRNAVVRLFFLTLCAGMFLASSACEQNGNGIGPSPIDTVYISIPAPDPARLDQAFLRYHRSDDAIFSSDPSKRPLGIGLFWSELKDGQKTYRSLDCALSTGKGIWDPETKIATCLTFEGSDIELPIDTEIEVWAVDEPLSPPQVGKEFIINGVLLPDPKMGTQPWPTGHFKLGKDLKPYW
ncbi:MAG: hypothetical protein A2941_00405 [Candidatus Yanofskybacteria bacterium RIFCSPLOWO2_01_FULL_49_17]|uniref:Lipoprotein n=1 Tax=Candidatus Yanofskybacteria bacterium RIFCSPLOWO2_01_FULL_49_17 TaxID=1802700 RepID=A0A1F8GRM7_9BACT|nr:MAG: hypothetical protein A2941_00405 [Candidatus Yanofskybacteria bacterium RIFCSPLOWO2_01_FULL_49_17]